MVSPRSQPRADRLSNYTQQSLGFLITPHYPFGDSSLSNAACLPQLDKPAPCSDLVAAPDTGALAALESLCLWHARDTRPGLPSYILQSFCLDVSWKTATPRRADASGIPRAPAPNPHDSHNLPGVPVISTSPQRVIYRFGAAMGRGQVLPNFTPPSPPPGRVPGTQIS